MGDSGGDSGRGKEIDREGVVVLERESKREKRE